MVHHLPGVSYSMHKHVSPPFRPHIRVRTERSTPAPIFAVAFTGVDFWLRIPVAAAILVKSPSQRGREVGRIIREHYAVWGGQRGPFGPPTGYVFQSLPDKAICYGVDGMVTVEKIIPTKKGEVGLGLRS
jgi:hypothetical protein